VSYGLNLGHQFYIKDSETCRCAFIQITSEPGNCFLVHSLVGTDDLVNVNNSYVPSWTRQHGYRYVYQYPTDIDTIRRYIIFSNNI
jgi:hypothetical protein